MIWQSMAHLSRLLILLLPVAILLLTDEASIHGQSELSSYTYHPLQLLQNSIVFQNVEALVDVDIYSNETEIKLLDEYPVDDFEEVYNS